MGDKPKTYTFGGRTFRIEPLTFRQEEWLRAEVLKDADVTTMKEADWRMLLQDTLPLFLAISFVEDGQTRSDKVKAGLPAVEALAEFLAIEGQPSLLWEIVPDFFGLNPPANLWPLVDYRRVRDAAPNTSTSSPSNSASSPTGISPSTS